MNRVLITGGTGFVGKWMKKTQPKNLDVMYFDSWHYELFANDETTEIDDLLGIVHLAPIAPGHIFYPLARHARRIGRQK